MRTKVWFDGHELTEWCIVGNLTRPLLPRTLTSVEVPGRDGKLNAGVTLADRTLMLSLTFRGKPEERAEKMRMVAAILNVSEAKELSISEDGGLCYMALPNAVQNGTRNVTTETFTVEFACEPLMRSTAAHEVSFDLAAGDTASFLVGGTAPTPALVTFTATTTRQSGLSIDTGERVLVGLDAGGTSETRYWHMDAEHRTFAYSSTAGGTRTNSVLPPSSSWLWLKPGVRTITALNQATEGTLRFSERWV